MGAGSAPQSQSPTLLGRYALYEKIASGGMASVHIGRLLGPVGFARTVAIKRMHPQFAEDPEFVSMFLDEARLAARIRHPNVVPTLDVVTMAGELFLVMDYVQGESLSRLIRVMAAKGERIQPRFVATLMVGVLHGLHAAHEAKNDRGEPLGIVHRDVSPHNVLVGTDGTPRVLDFGVAKAAGRVQTTREGQLKGKLAYMAPEQVNGGAVTRSSDIYAASVVLWEALSGKRLFAADSEANVLRKVLAGCSIPPSRFAPDLPPELDAVTMRGLSAEPEQRFATAREMARALENAVPLVAPSVIGEWVEETAKDALEERSARIAAIETNTAVHPVSASSIPVAHARTTEGPPPRVAAAAAAAAVEDLHTQLSSGSVSAPRKVSWFPGTPGRRTRAAALVVGGGAALFGLGVLTVVSVRREPPTSSASPAVAPPPPASTVAAAPPVLSPDPSSVTPPPAPSDSAVASAAPAVVPRQAPPAAAHGPPPRVASPASSRATSSQCVPPYYFNAQGVRVFKPECL